MLVSRISPAPSRTHSAAHSTASSSVGRLPPCVYTTHRFSRRFASMLATTHCDPKRSALSVKSCGDVTAAEFRLTLSAPERSASITSLVEPMPPPTVNGTKSCSAVRRTTASSVARFSAVAEMSRNTSSSAPSRSYWTAIAGGSPTSRSCSKRVPFTTRPSFTSRQTMSRRVSMRGPRMASASAALERDSTFGTEHRISLLESRAQRHAKCLEGSFDDMVAVIAANDTDVERRPGVVAEGTHPVIVQGARKRTAIIRPSTDIDACLNERVIHCNRLITVTGRAGGSDFRHRSAHSDRHILDNVVLQVAGRLELDIQRRVPGERYDHVIEKGDTGGGLRLAAAEIQLQPDSRLSRLSLHRRHSGNSSATARGSTAPVYNAIPMIAAEMPRSASARRSFIVLIPPAAKTGNTASSTAASLSD